MSRPAGFWPAGRGEWAWTPWANCAEWAERAKRNAPAEPAAWVMGIVRAIWVAGFASTLLAALPAMATPVQPGDAVVVNAQPLPAAQRQQLEERYRTRLRPGRYWYDAATGWWGLEGGPTLGLVHAGQALGGPLRSDASNGSTGVYLNGRHLHPLEVSYLRTLGPVWPGRYWVDAWGNVGLDGQRQPFANLYQLAHQRHGGTRPAPGSSGAFSSEGNCLMYQRRDLSGTSYGASVGC